MRISFFGSSLVSSYWNGAATYYRGIIRALNERGHSTRFFEPDAFERQSHRDMENPAWAKVVVWPPNESGRREALRQAADADVIVKASGVGVFDEELEREVLELRDSDRTVIFWDVDAPATLDRMEQDPEDAFRSLVPEYNLILTYGGGRPVIEKYEQFGARRCVPIYNALDLDTHHPVASERRFEADLAFLGNRLPDREARVNEYFFRTAARLPNRTFLLGGSGWDDRLLPENMRYVGHVGTADHNAFNCSPLAILNISRASMARYGFSPATRVFEAAGAAACLITDAWNGIEEFLKPGWEVLVARNGDEVANILADLHPERAQKIGERARQRVLEEHTYKQRAVQVEGAILGAPQAV